MDRQSQSPQQINRLQVEVCNFLSQSREMFVRFVCNRPHPTVDAELGMFTARDEIDFSQLKGSVQKAHEEAFYWFSSKGGGQLKYPKLRGKQRTYEVRKSLFWFKSDARFFLSDGGRMVDRARQLAAALTVAGCEIREIRMRDPGKILWEDSNQVLAFPGETAVPKAF
ncbi:hypothetical protein [Roseibium sp.]|uniref:hypothetical protein n=1 Tax=Roseibium sp. TaxID=1936156 RepID=UPI003D0AD577